MATRDGIGGAGDPALRDRAARVLRATRARASRSTAGQPLEGEAKAARRTRIAELAAVDAYPVPAADTSIPAWPGETISVAGVQTFVRKTPSNNPDAEPALYVHGLGGSSSNFTELADLLSPWFDGHALDLPGFGNSGPALHDDYSIAAHARVVIRYLEESGRGPVHLVGNSMGGAISIKVAATRPELVRTLTLVSPAVPDLRPRGGGDALLPLLMLPGLGGWMLGKVDQGSPERRAKAVIDICFAHPENVPVNRLAESAADVLTRRGMPWARNAMISSLRGLVGTYLTPGTKSPWQLMKLINAPTVVVWGEMDRLVDVSNAPKVAATIPDATLLVLPDVGHVAQLEDPTVTARAILALRERAIAARSSSDMGV
jgi:pimeloyl-ACP methyl ester carboxylesterase